MTPDPRVNAWTWAGGHSLVHLQNIVFNRYDLDSHILLKYVEKTDFHFWLLIFGNSMTCALKRYIMSNLKWARN